MSLARARRFWLGYAAAWLLVFAVYFFAFFASGRMTLGTTALGAAGNVLPDALLGVAVVHLCARLWRERRAPGAWLPPLALAFAAVASFVKGTLNIQLAHLEGRELDWASFDRGILLWQVFFSLLAFAMLTSVTFGLSASARLRAEEERRAQAELVRARAELKALRAQLEPHFLFNTLHSVRALIRENPAAAEQALEELGDLLRYALRVQDAAEDGVSLSEEWQFVRAYLALEQLRFGERLRVEADVSEAALQCVVPAFVLQPLVENALRHGLGARARGGTLWIRAALADGELELEVRDDGAGASTAVTPGTGRGLDLVRARLRALYGARGTLAVTARPGTGFAVVLRFPGAPGRDVGEGSW